MVSENKILIYCKRKWQNCGENFTMMSFIIYTLDEKDEFLSYAIYVRLIGEDCLRNYRIQH
jgi:hypothetical protein